ncbi:MAG: pyridine nucleotide-disulfide oxidoreductase [Herbinix sp.]|jgi:NADPH-dependent glutamate synthase beta subunit-like oxidoreductase|nr:pyridine nucleotide-disulfide oxidoreductase [Herbinix sp.]
MKQSIQRIPFSKALPVGERTYRFSVEVDTEKCTGCGICAIECPSRIIEMAPSQLNQCNKKANCSKNCLCENEVRIALNQLEEGQSTINAWETVTAVNPFPSVLGRLCSHPCEDACNRSYLDQSVNLHEAERFIGDYAIENNLEFKKPDFIQEGKAAVVGGGISGLTCAYHLARNGYRVTVFDENEKMGGIVQYAIPSFRIPRNILDAEIERLRKLGIEFRNNTRIGVDYTLEQLKESYDAIYMAVGCHREAQLNVSGEEDTQNMFDFLEEVVSENPTPIKGVTVVVGGGNSAMDVARTALRRGSARVIVLCLESRYEMKASEQEIREALAEGIELLTGLAIQRIEKKNDGKKCVYLKKCIRIFDEEGKFNPEYEELNHEYINADLIIKAIGLYPETDFLLEQGLKTTQRGNILIKDYKTMQTETTGVFAGGDIVAHPKSGTIGGGISLAIAAAKGIVNFLDGKFQESTDGNRVNISRNQERYNLLMQRQEGKEILFHNELVDWKKDYVEGLTKDQLLLEAKRCLACGQKHAVYIGAQNTTEFNRACHNCHNCVSICPEGAITFKYTTIYNQ